MYFKSNDYAVGDAASARAITAPRLQGRRIYTFDFNSAKFLEREAAHVEGFSVGGKHFSAVKPAF